jgi:hypothetical protein
MADELNAVEQRERDSAEMIEVMFRSGFEVKPRVNGGYVVSVYVKKSHEAAFTAFEDMIRWLADALAEDLPTKEPNT